MKITLIISSLGAGGAERVMSIMANYWADKGWDITIVTLAAINEDFYSLNSNVKRVALNKMSPSTNVIQSILANLMRLKILRNVVARDRPDLIISFVDKVNVLVILATLGLRIPVVISERTDPTRYSIGKIWDVLRKNLYAYATYLVVQTEKVRKWAEENWHKLPACVIENPVKTIDVNKESNMPFPSGEWILAVGRLEKMKGFDLLLKAYSMATLLHKKNVRLAIIGEGSQRSELEKMIIHLGLDSLVWLVGEAKQIDSYYHHASLFVLSSRFEGFPNSLIEAMAWGLPVISFDCSSGPGEIIQNGLNGVLVTNGDVVGLRDAMTGLMEESKKRMRIGNNAKESSRHYRVDVIMNKWENLIFEVCGR